MDIQKQRVLTLMGPSGAGKSTLLKCLNRFHELSEGVHVRGDILFHGESIFDRNLDVDEHRRKVGMLFQQPVVFPKSIAQNVIIKYLCTRIIKVLYPYKVERYKFFNNNSFGNFRF